MPKQSPISPWNDFGWKPYEGPVFCKDHPNAKVYMSRGDGVTMGTCAECNACVVRLNPKTNEQEIPDPDLQ